MTTNPNTPSKLVADGANITINVRKVSVTVATDGTITCTPDPVNVSASNVMIAFSLDTPGYVFPDSGAIVGNIEGGQFPYASWTVKPQLAGLLDLNTANGLFEYTVNVVNSTTGQQFSLDPGVQNQGH
jgi:hypothetical protein